MTAGDEVSIFEVFDFKVKAAGLQISALSNTENLLETCRVILRAPQGFCLPSSLCLCNTSEELYMAVICHIEVGTLLEVASQILRECFLIAIIIH